ncbi:MAG: 39S ribosomal protein L44, mitochondrial [Chrysothrix sp. TS-e1954]|nr:MAG: 39S ribosomal protein L44, mitochondrial [Chrysothrix sp. TS-e1954]
MNTKHLSTLTCAFSPLSPTRAHRVPRIILSFLGPNARSPAGDNITVAARTIPSSSPETPSLILKFKDGKILKWVVPKVLKGKRETLEEGAWDLRATGVKDVVEECARHSRVLGRKAELGG